MKASSIELLKDTYGGTFEENVKTILNKHFDSDSAENLWNQIVEKYSELFQKLNISEEDEDAVYYILPSVAVYRVLEESGASEKVATSSGDKACTDVHHIDVLSKTFLQSRQNFVCRRRLLQFFYAVCGDGVETNMRKSNCLQIVSTCN